MMTLSQFDKMESMQYNFIAFLLILPGLINGGYVSNPGGYEASIGGYPYPVITESSGYSSSPPIVNSASYSTNSNNNIGGYAASNSESSSGGGYGPPCCPNKYPFLPAPPGRTPPCSKHGQTFCEKLDGYPTETIRYLLYKWGATYSQFIKTELNQDFVMMAQNYSYFYPKPEYGANLYGSYGAPTNHYSFNTHFNNSYQQQQYHQPQYQQQQQQQPTPFYNFQPTALSSSQAAAIIVPPLLHSIWWNHRDKDTSSQAFPYLAQHRLQRVKRQASTENQLCRISSRFITPRAAMNNQGNWMYLVNMDDSRFIQQVRTDECAEGDGAACDGLCSIPPGYRASCKQKYVQKSLVALDGSGSNLRSEVFWFPHCCVCEVTRG